MGVFQTNKSALLTMTAIILIGLCSLNIFAQEKEESKSKMDQLKGKVEKITVKVDGKDIVFEGKDAEKMADQLRTQKKVKFYTSSDLQSEDGKDGKVVVFKSRGKGDDTFDVSAGNMKKKVNIENKEGKKVITVTTTIDGKEETKTYEGDEAEKFLKDEKGMKNISVVVTDGDDNDGGNMVYFNRRAKGPRMRMRSNCCCGNGCGMDMAPMHGNGHVKMMLKKMDKDDGDVKVVEGKKLEKKEQKKIEKK